MDITYNAYSDCPHYQKRESQLAAIRAEIEDERKKIEGDMRSLGLKPENMSSLVATAAMLGVKAHRLQMEAMLTDPYYTETSREGNEKPVSHPIHSSASAAANAYANALKQLGISASAEKVSTKVADDSGNKTPLELLLSENGK